jgi:hypothetical protein
MIIFSPRHLMDLFPELNVCGAIIDKLGEPRSVRRLSGGECRLFRIIGPIGTVTLPSCNQHPNGPADLQKQNNQHQNVDIKQSVTVRSVGVGVS